MGAKSKRYKSIKDLIKVTESYSIKEAVSLIKKSKKLNFDETLDIAINLGVDPKHADQIVKGVVQLPHGTGKVVKIAVFAKDEKAKEAKDAGADFVGSEDLAQKLEKSEIKVDRVIATPDMMATVGKLGKVLGPKGLMPNPKLGTVTENLKTAISDAKSGQAEIRNDKDGNIGVSIGKKSFSDEKLIKNFNAVIDTLEKEKSNNTVKGDLIRTAFVTSTMGVSYKLKLGKNI